MYSFNFYMFMSSLSIKYISSFNQLWNEKHFLYIREFSYPSIRCFEFLFNPTDIFLSILVRCSFITYYYQDSLIQFSCNYFSSPPEVFFTQFSSIFFCFIESHSITPRYLQQPGAVNVLIVWLPGKSILHVVKALPLCITNFAHLSISNYILIYPSLKLLALITNVPRSF